MISKLRFVTCFRQREICCKSFMNVLSALRSVRLSNPTVYTKNLRYLGDTLLSIDLSQDFVCNPQFRALCRDKAVPVSLCIMILIGWNIPPNLGQVDNQSDLIPGQKMCFTRTKSSLPASYRYFFQSNLVQSRATCWD